MEKGTDIFGVKDNRKFEVQCRAGDAGGLCVGAELVSVKVGQLLRTKDGEQIWHSIMIQAEEDDEGTLVVKVLVFNPDWDEPLQIASISSRPDDKTCETSLGCNLDHVKP